MKKIFCILVMCCGVVFAQEVRELSVKQAVDAAIEGNINIQKSRVSLEASKRAKDSAWNSVSPSVRAQASYSDSTTDENRSSTSVSGSVNLSFSPSVFSSVQSAAKSYEAQEISYEQAVRAVELKVRKDYYGILYKMETIKLQEGSVETSKNQYESNLAKYNRGLLSKLDVLSQQISYQNSVLTLDNTKTSLSNDIALFKQSLGLPQNVELKLTEKISASPESKISLAQVSELNGQSLTLAALQKQLEAAKAGLYTSRFSAWGPTLSAGYTYSSAKNAQTQDEWKNSDSYNLGVSIPLDGFLPWSNGALNIASKKDSLKNLEIQLEDEKVSYEVTVNNYLNKIQQSQEGIKLRKNSIDLAQQTYDMTLESYNHGTKDLLSLQTSYQNLLSARVNLMSEEYNLICTILDLENIMGLPFGSLGE